MQVAISHSLDFNDLATASHSFSCNELKLELKLYVSNKFMYQYKKRRRNECTNRSDLTDYYARKWQDVHIKAL